MRTKLCVCIGTAIVASIAMGFLFHAHRSFNAYTVLYAQHGILIEHQRMAGTIRIQYHSLARANDASKRYVVYVPDYYDSHVVKEVQRDGNSLTVSFVNGRSVFVVGDTYSFTRPNAAPQLNDKL